MSMPEVWDLLDEPPAETPEAEKPKPQAKSEPAAEPEGEKPVLPAWAPEQLADLPPQIRASLLEAMQPLYEQYVMNAPDPLERSLGLTLVHTTWMEILEQFDQQRLDANLILLRTSGNREQQISQNLRLLAAKVRVGQFLGRFRQMRREWATWKEQDNAKQSMPKSRDARTSEYGQPGEDEWAALMRQLARHASDRSSPPPMSHKSEVFGKW